MNSPCFFPLFQAPIEDRIKNLTYDDSALDVEPEIPEQTPPLPDSDADVVVDKKTADDDKRGNWIGWSLLRSLLRSLEKLLLAIATCTWGPIFKFLCPPMPAPCHEHRVATRRSHPRLLGKFRRPHNESPYASSCCTNIFKYHIVSLHFPREHHYLDGGANLANPPWIAKVTLFLRDLDTLTECPLPWRNHSHSYHEWTIPPPEVDRDSHPGADKAAPMFKQSWKIDFGPENGLSWRAEVTLWAQDEEKIREVLYGRRTIKKIINKESNVCMEALRTEPATTRLWPRRRFFIKYPEDLDLIDVADPWVPEPGGHFCIARDKTVEVDEPELAKVMEEQMERHLFGEEHDPNARTLRCNLCGGDSYV